MTAPAGTDRAAAEGFAGLGPAAVRWLVLVLVAAVLAGVVPLALLQAVPDDLRSGAWRLTLAVMVWAGLRLAHRIAVGRPALFDFVFWLFAYIFMGLAPTAQMRADQPSTTTPGLDPVDDARIAAVVLVGLACYEIGRAVARHGSSWGAALRGRADGAAAGGNAADDDAAPGGRDADRPVLDVVPRRAVVLTVVGVLAAAYFVTRVGFSTLFMSRYTAYDIRSERMPDVAVRSIVSAAGSYPLLVAAGVYLRIWATRALGARSTRYAPLLALAVVVLLTVVNPISAARYDFGTVVFALVVIVGAVGHRGTGPGAHGGGRRGAAVRVPVADAFRSDSASTPARNGFFGEYLANPDYDAFWQIGNALLYADERPRAQPLRQATGVLLFWVPRRSVAGQADRHRHPARRLPRVLVRATCPRRCGPSCWSTAGVVALIVGFVLLGVLLGRLDDRVVGRAARRRAAVGGRRRGLPDLHGDPAARVAAAGDGTLVVAIACVLYVRRGPRPHRRVLRRTA